MHPRNLEERSRDSGPNLAIIWHCKRDEVGVGERKCHCWITPIDQVHYLILFHSTQQYLEAATAVVLISQMNELKLRNQPRVS